MIAQDQNGIGYERIPLLRRVGFDYVELPLAQMMALEDKAFESGPLAALEHSGLPCYACNNFFPASYKLTGTASDPERALAYARVALQRASRLGAKFVVFGSSGARNMPRGTNPRKALTQLSTLLYRIADIAEKHDIMLVIEHLNPSESNLINFFSQGLELARLINHPQIAVLVDLYHLRLVRESLENLSKANTLLVHAHLARTLNRSLPLPNDEEDYIAFFSVLKQMNYAGNISIEAYMQPDQNEKQLKQSLCYIKSCAK